MEGLTDKQVVVVEKLIELANTKGEAVTPTEVGIALEYDYASASAKCMNAINAAIKRGYIKRVGRGKYVAA
ncbi:hypothetical protein ACOMCU_01010 [Lysinibacillus sp. UGB7]|uniref:hypothetical protein n=1 Tax=Lysinibacillus TaxID=400634 RepID=UPI0018CEE437|nr:hypothetical protein [Lysinibacillus sphaericus]MBG9693256.1 hypothetical protein [Lysinibacillus sphaericus]